MKKIFEPSFYNRSAQYLIASSNTGQQQWSFTYFATQSSLKKIADFIQTVNNSALQNQPSRFLLESANLKQTFVNNSTVPVTLRIFHCRQKRDTWFSTTSPMNYTSALNNVYPWNGDPVGAITQGLAAAGNYLSGDSTPSIIPGAMPHESQIFKDYFAIHKVTEVEMAMGGSHRLETNKVFNKVIDASIYGDTPLVGITGFTEFLVYQAVGSPIHDVTTNTFTTCPVNIGVVETLEYRYTQAMSSVRALYSDNTLTQNVGDTLNQIQSWLRCRLVCDVSIEDLKTLKKGLYVEQDAVLGSLRAKRSIKK